MKRRIETLEKTKVLLEIIEISREINANSIEYQSNLGSIIDLESIFESEGKNYSGQELTYALNILLCSKNEGFSVEVELFWEKVFQKNILIERKDPLAFVFRKGRFLHVSQAMMVRKNWEGVKKAGYLHQRYSNTEITFLENIITTDENKRANAIRKSLEKGKVLDSYIKKFVEAVVYFEHTSLFEKYFNDKEVIAINTLRNERYK